MYSLRKRYNSRRSKRKLNKIEINKSPGNDGLTRELYKGFWDHVKTPLLLSFKIVFLKKELRRPISLLSVGVKLISKVTNM